MPEWKRGVFKVTKLGVLKFTGLALTVAFAINITNVTNQIHEKQVVQGEVSTAEMDSTVVAAIDSLIHRGNESERARDSVITRLAATLSELETRTLQPRASRDSVVLRYVTVPIESLIVVPIFETTFKESTRWVLDTLRVETKKPFHWALSHGGPVIL